MSKIGTKKILSMFGLELENNIVIFQISTLEFVQFKNIVKFGLVFENNIEIFEISSLEFV